ncbi:bifunctional riboflavin kinase/FAD synthetase [Sphingoaurantiacus capsulatus]|uniref:Riboflavin biosynthesis protein n=1 Tax=Sphingoaurantiacus capsulatus TaxID=1771310 RepID=A0ABV7XA09_9SPHN
MERFIHAESLPAHLRGGVAALGNFDGFHRGHQAVVGRALERARAEGRPALVVTFDPHPARLFKPDLPPFGLTTIPQRLDLFEGFGVDGALVLNFDHALAALTGDEFVLEWLALRLGLAGAVTGEDFTYGKGRSGSVEELARLGEVHGFAAEAIAPIADGDEVISSSRIREALKAGDPQAAAALLTRPFTVRGRVEHGDKLGRTLDFPTANIALGDYLRPAYGVYAVRVRLVDGRLVDGVANLGIRPMFEPPKELLEVYLFDFSGDLYGQELDVELHHFLRPEWKLDGLDALKAQIARDCDEARARLAR